MFHFVQSTFGVVHLRFTIAIYDRSKKEYILTHIPQPTRASGEFDIAPSALSMFASMEEVKGNGLSERSLYDLLMSSKAKPSATTPSMHTITVGITLTCAARRRSTTRRIVLCYHFRPLQLPCVWPLLSQNKLHTAA